MKSLFERFLQVRGYDLAKAIRQVEQISALGPDDLRLWQDERKKAIVRFHFDHNPLYRRKVGALLPSVWNSLPIMDKKDFQGDLMSLVTPGIRRNDLYCANTSGSSGHPFWFAKDKYAHACTWALVKQRYAWYGLTPSSKQARFYGIPLERWPYYKETSKDLLMNRVRFPVFDLSDAVLRHYAHRFTRIRFDYVYGYNNSLVLFAQYLLRNDLCLKALCPTLKACLITSEVCTPENRAMLSEAFGVQIVNEYGTSEVGVIAFEDTAGDWLLSEETVFVEVVDGRGHPVADGSSGHLLVTDLQNRAFPFIRYRLGDVGAVACRHGSRRHLLRLEGRENDTILLPSGKKCPGLTFYYVSRSLLESSGVLREFIIRQTSPSEFVFDVVADRPLTAEEEALLRAKVEMYLESGLVVRINCVPSITRPASGKIKHFYSYL